MRAAKHLDKCDETECKFNPTGICGFALRNRVGCYMDSNVKECVEKNTDTFMKENVMKTIKDFIGVP